MIELKLPDPDAVRELWAVAWRQLTTPFRSLLPEGLAEFALVAFLLTLAALASRFSRKYVAWSLVGLWVAIAFSLVLVKLGRG